MTDAVVEELLVQDERVEANWQELQQWLHQSFGSEPGIEGILFLIGVQASGKGYQPHLRKERKQDLIMDGTYRAFEALGFYRQVPGDAQDSPSWVRTSRPMPVLLIDQQEKLLKLAILRYFSDQNVVLTFDSDQAT